MDKVTVIQADREAAAAVIMTEKRWPSLRDKVAAELRDGISDDYVLVQAFAKHREASATPAPDSEKLREAHNSLVETADYLIDSYQRLWRGGVVRDLAEAEGAYQAAKDFMALTMGASL